MTRPDPNATDPADPGGDPAIARPDEDFLEPDDADAVSEADRDTKTVPPPPD